MKEIPYSAAEFDSWWKFLLRFCPFSGLNCRVQRTDHGTILGADETLFWKHPWTFSPSLRDDGQGGSPYWVTLVEPGFVNGQNVLIHDDVDAVYKPLTAQVAPLLALSWRDALRSGNSFDSETIDFGPGAGYPLFFKNYGIKPKTDQFSTDFGINPDPLSTRELRACDVALIVPRIGTRQSISFGDIIGDGQIVKISTSLNLDGVQRYGETPYRLGAFSQWSPPAEPTYIDRLLGNTEEPVTDEIKIGTIWAVSSPDASIDDVPGLGWQLYPQYDCFFNLGHVSKNQLPTIPPRPITFITPLAAGVGNLLIASFLDPINDAYNAVSEMFANATFKGTFYSL